MYAAAPKNLRLSIPNWAETPVAPVQKFSLKDDHIV